MRAIFLGLGLIAAGCSDPAADAERRMNIAERNGDYAEVCSQAKQIAAELLKQEREQKYREAKVAADIYCMRATQEAVR